MQLVTNNTASVGKGDEPKDLFLTPKVIERDGKYFIAIEEIPLEDIHNAIGVSVSKEKKVSCGLSIQFPQSFQIEYKHVAPNTSVAKQAKSDLEAGAPVSVRLSFSARGLWTRADVAYSPAT